MGKFVKGQSGNPGGLKQGKKAREAFEPHDAATVARMIELRDHENPAIAVRACEYILDRIHGKALSASEILLRDERAAVTATNPALTPAEIRAGVAEVLARAAAEVGIAAGGLSQEELARQLLAARDGGEPEPPALYEATLPEGLH